MQRMPYLTVQHAGGVRVHEMPKEKLINENKKLGELEGVVESGFEVWMN